MEKGQYPVSPSDADEFRRLSLQDNLLNKLFPLLPDGVPQPKRILDIACGSGGWLKLVAEQYPDCECIGIDKNSLLLGHASNVAMHLHNLTYTQADFFDLPKLLKSKQFDYVQMRLSTWFVGARKQEVFRAIKDLLTPGGTLCVIEFDQPYPTTSAAWRRYSELFFAAMNKRGVTYIGTSEFSPLFRATGFKNIRLSAQVIDLSDGSTQAFVNDVRSSVQTLGKMIVSSGLLSEDEFDTLKQQCLQDMNSPDFGMLAYFLSITGQKP